MIPLNWGSEFEDVSGVNSKRCTGGVVSQFPTLVSKLQAEQESNAFIKARHWNLFTSAFHMGCLSQHVLFTLVKMQKLLNLERATICDSLGPNLIGAVCANFNDK